MYDESNTNKIDCHPNTCSKEFFEKVIPYKIEEIHCQNLSLFSECIGSLYPYDFDKEKPQENCLFITSENHNVDKTSKNEILFLNEDKKSGFVRSDDEDHPFPIYSSVEECFISDFLSKAEEVSKGSQYFRPKVKIKS
jgi:hypothetical protein